MDSPVGFEPTDDEFVRMVDLPAWEYTGPPEPGIQHIRAHHTEVLVYSDEGVYYVDSKWERLSMSTSVTPKRRRGALVLGHR